MYLYARKYINGIKTEFGMIDWISVFYKDYQLYSDLPQESIEILHTYIVGTYSERRDGYVANWTDDDPLNDGLHIPSIRVLRKHTSQHPSIADIEQTEEYKANIQDDDINYALTGF